MQHEQYSPYNKILNATGKSDAVQVGSLWSKGQFKVYCLSTYVYILCRLLHPLCWDPEEGGTGKTQDVLTYSPVELQTTVEQLFQQ